MWRREWFIPADKTGQFFSFWRRNKFDMLAKGYGVHKNKHVWVLTETKTSCLQFKNINEPQNDTPEETFILPFYDLKEKSGLRPWQVEAAGKLVSAIKHWGCALDGSDTGCHAKGQDILMSNGNIKKVEDIVVGDVVMGWKGPQTVTELKRGRQQMVKIIPTKGEAFTVNLDHILTLQLTNGSSKEHKQTGGYKYGSIIDIKVRDFLKLSKTTKHAMKLFSTSVSWEEKMLPFSPYFIGLLLGDGGLSLKSAITFTNTDNVLWESVIKEAEKFGWKIGNTNEKITKRITNSPDLLGWLRQKGLSPSTSGTKFIPIEYKTGSVYQRLEILAGLLDTDGYYSTGGYSFCVKSKQLAQDVGFIASSVGLFSHTKPIIKTCTNTGVSGTYYITHISGDCSIIPCRVPHKKASKRKQKKNVLRRGFTLKILGEEDYYGFSLSGDGRFLLGDFTVTHNSGKTYSACAVARELGYKIVVVCPKAVITSWNRVIKDHFGMENDLIGVVNYEQLRIGKTSSPIASYVRNRTTHREKFTWKIPKRTLIIWDESQKLKNWKTKNAKMCVEAFKQGYQMLFCSATNATNPLELRAVGTCLKLFKGNRDYYKWVYEHGCFKGRFGLEFNNDPVALQKIHRAIFDQRGVRLKRDEIPGFPDSEIIADAYNIDSDGTKRINEIYSDMKKELAMLDKRKKKDGDSPLTIILRARQKVEFIKVPLFVEMIEEGLEAGMSVVVFVNFTETIRALAKRLKIKCIFDGKESDKNRQKNVDDFQSDKERVILVNIMSGGAGLSLHDLNGNYPRLALISPTYSAVMMRQALGRVWRDSSKTKSVQKIVSVVGTVEEEVCATVQQKLNNLDLLNDGDLACENKE